MRWFISFMFSFVLCYATAQETGLLKQEKFDKHFVFRNGIYLSFDEFKENNPSITDFKVVRSSQFSGEVFLEYQCVDESTGVLKTCYAQKCWGYAQNNNVYISQGISGYFFRLHIIGALIHFYSVELYSMPYYDYSYGYPAYRTNRRAENREFVIEFNSGRKFEFNYRNFSRFLMENDRELYDELQNTKRKKKMIYHFLIRYNEKHPVYFPAG